jgi:prepilin-type N-terminal cleavage/methylation domain-containing protein
MLNKIKKSRSEGFTIIEVMIVLAIAALILLIVLLAVPALQRNSRNTAIKNDASAVVGGISEFASNNDGKSPTQAQTICTSPGSISLNDNASDSPAKPKIQGSTALDCSKTGAQTITLTNADTGKLYLVFAAKCPDTVSGQSVATSQSTRSTAVIYAVETNDSSKPLAKCVDG